MIYEDRQYQIKALDDIKSEFRQGFKKVGLMLATGSGKTRIAQMMIEPAIKSGKRVYFICDRLSLIDQTAQRFWGDGFSFGIIQGDNHLNRPDCKLQICSIQTLKNRAVIPPDLAIVDEFHTGYKHLFEFMQKWDKTYFVGLSATPWTRGLGQHWKRLVAGPSVSWLMSEGYLSSYKAIVGHREVDTSDIKTSNTAWGKDFNQKQAGERINKKELVADIVDTWLEVAENRKTMVFAQNVAHATEIVADFKSRGVDARKVDCYMKHNGESSEQVIKDFRNNKFKVIVSVDMIVKGFDVPDVECLVIARITQSLMWHIQALGRGLRAYEGKDYCLILDHAGNISRLGYPDDDLPTELDDGKREPRRKVKPKPKPCPKCRTLFRGSKCPECGYERKGENRKSHVETVSGKMIEVSKNGKTNGKVYTTNDKRKWYGMFLYVQLRLEKSDKWLLAQYKSKFGVWPRSMDNVQPIPANSECLNWLNYQRIKWAKSKKASKL